jgi:NAD(P)-dependent dehydrogenase (short-subunit alcohol dehydrogenase family)
MGTLRDKVQDGFGDEMEGSDMPAMDARVGIGAAVVLALLVAGAGFVIIRRRRRRSLAKRLQEALPELNDLRATLKRPLQRAVKAL